jgi:hypothetical protein
MSAVVSPVSVTNNNSSRNATRAKTFLSDIAEGKDWTFERSVPGRSFSISVGHKLRFATAGTVIGALMGGISSSVMCWGMPAQILWAVRPAPFFLDSVLTSTALSAGGWLHIGAKAAKDLTDRKIGYLMSLANDYKTLDHQTTKKKLETVIKTAGAYIQSRDRATYFLGNTLMASYVLWLFAPRPFTSVLPALAALGIVLAGGAEYHHRIYKKTRLEKIREQANECLRMMEKNQK